MPADPSVVTVIVRIAHELKGASKSQAAFAQIQKGAERASESVGSLSKEVTRTGQNIFRYTFYAMWFAQVAQAYLGMRVVRAFLAPAEAADIALARLRGLVGATYEELQAIADFADTLSTSVPFGFSEIVQAVEAGVRAGLELADAMEVVRTATHLALIEGTNLAEATEFLSQVMFSFDLTAEGVAEALGKVYMAAKESPYSFGQITYAMRLTMASASALGQSLESLLALISIFGKAGVPAAQAATMINQVFTRLGDPETMTLIEGLLEYGALIPEVLERVGGEMPVLFDMEKGLGDIGEAMIAAAQTVAYLREEAMKEGWLGEFDRVLMQVLYRAFGVRNIRAFLTLAKVSVQEYRELKQRIAEATEAVEEYMAAVSQSWQYTRQIAGNAINNLLRLIGSGMLALFQPIVRFFGEVVNGFFLVAKEMPLLMDLAAGFFGVVTTVGAATAAISSFVLVLSLLRDRLQDIGTYVMRTPELFAKVAGIVPAGATPVAVGKAYVFGRFLPFLRGLAAVATTVAVLFAAWRARIRASGGAMDELSSKTEKFKEKIGDLAQRMGAWFRQATTRPQTALQVIVGAIYNTFVGALNAMGKVVSWAFSRVVQVIQWAARIVGTAAGWIGRGLAYILGLGDVEAGYKRLYAVLEWFFRILTVLAMFKVIGWATTRALASLKLFWRVLKGILLGVDLTKFGIPLKLPGLLRLLKFFFAPLRILLNFFRDVIQFLRAAAPTLGWGRAITAALRRFVLLPLKNLLLRVITRVLGAIVEALSKLGPMLEGGGLLAPILRALRKFIVLPLINILGKLLTKVTTLGGLSGAGGLLGGLGGIFAKIAGFWWLLPLLAALGGVGYGLYRLFTRPREEYTPPPPSPTGFLPPAYAATTNVTISPTIIVPQGTPAEQAALIMKELEGRLVEFFKTQTWREKQLAFERSERAGITI